MKRLLIGAGLFFTAILALAQGPPITLDKPIMLGPGNGTVRTYIKAVDLNAFSYYAWMLEGDYNLSGRLAVGAELPLTATPSLSEVRLGDIAAMLKYQFVRRDGKGKTLRIAAKAKHMIPTGRKLESPLIGMGHHMTYAGLLAAYESLSLGVQTELGYAHSYGGTHLNQLQYKLGAGLPLLKPTYPVNQITVYLETEGINLPAHHGETQYGYYYAPGLQYARGKFTFDLALQLPLAQRLQASLHRNWTGLAGARMIL